MNLRKRTLAGIILCWTVAAANFAIAQGYRVERVASDLAQPTFLTQAPGDPANIVYYSTRITATDGTGGGFGAVNNMGGIFRYDLNTRTSTQVMNLSYRQLTGDEGLVGFAFSPDYNTPGAPGYQKLYVSSSQYNNGASPIERVEEYTTNGPNGTVPLDVSNHAAVTRTILQYTNINTQQNHTVDWIGFDPTAASLPAGTPERNYLYISAGDGDLGGSAQTRPEQKANSVLGKVLRVDTDPTHADAYPLDANKNFAIPSTNPIPQWNAAHDGTQQLSGTHLTYSGGSPTAADYTPALGEIYFTGTRNTFRMSIDRQTGDYWMGDVGENTREEVNFLKAGTYNGTQPPVDFGYSQREGTTATSSALAVANSSGATSVQWNLSGGGNVVVNSTNPVREGDHTTGRSSYIGGYVYRGPISELQGQYFYADFVKSNVFAVSGFDRNTPLASYSGANFNQDPTTHLAALGIQTAVATADINSPWNTLIFDPTDPNYNSSLGASFGIGRVVSFGEDNSGNMYVIDFGGVRGDPGFGSDYPNAGKGQIFMLVPNLQVKMTINRDTGEMTLQNQTGNPVDIRSYSLTSGHGSIDPSHVTTITGHYDANPPGNGSIDANDHWQITSANGSHSQLAEQTQGDIGTLPTGSSFSFSGSGGWTKSIYQDLQLSFTLGNGSTVQGIVEYVGNGGQAFIRSDLNFNGVLDPADWTIFHAHHLENMAGLSLAQAYELGDLNGDGKNDFDDFRLFQTDYIAAHGAAAFASLLGIPEPSTFALLAIGCGALLVYKGRRDPKRREVKAFFPVKSRRRNAFSHRYIPGAVALLILFESHANAALQHRYSFNEGAAADASNRIIVDSVGGANGVVRGAGASATATQLVLPGGSSTTQAYVDLPNGIVSSLTNATFEGWYTMTGTQSWGRIFDFGSTVGGEVTGPGGGGEGQDYIFYAASRGTDQNTQRVAMRNLDPAFGGGTAGTVSGTEAPVLDPGLAYTLGTQRHIAVVYNSTGGSAPGLGSVALYLNGTLAPGITNPMDAPYQLRNLNDVNNWLGRSNWTADSNFQGSLNEFRIYDDAKTAADVLTDFNAGPDVAPTPNFLQLRVNTLTGTVTIKNNVPASPIDIDYYRIKSSGGALSVAGWNSLDNQNVDAVGAGEGQSWDKTGAANAAQLAELYLLGHSTVSSTKSLQLGLAFNPSIFGMGVNGDLTFEYGVVGNSSLLTGTIAYVTPGPLAGDYNHNGIVDAADYTIWRDTLGSTTNLQADGDNSGIIDQADFVVWRATFGNSMGAGAEGQAASVPEPGLAILLLTAAMSQAGFVGCGKWRRRATPASRKRYRLT
jgi:Concanavalin A-like lectin/glucanases superfamily/Glucose / Sorbosone dehydrogenase